MEDLGVDWPDMDAPDPVVEALPGEEEGAPTLNDTVIDDSVAARRYSVKIEGLGEVTLKYELPK